MSFVSASTTPHSRPERTSSTSSLKRRSDWMVVAETMTSPRYREILANLSFMRPDDSRFPSDKLRKLSEGRPQTPSEVLLRQSREER